MMKKLPITLVSAVVLCGIATAGYKFWQQKAVEETVSELQAPVNEAFDQNVLITKAYKLARKDFEQPTNILPQELKDLDYDKIPKSPIVFSLFAQKF